MNNDMMQKKGVKKLHTQAVATIIGLCVAFAILLATFILSEVCINQLENEIFPLLDEAVEAVNSGDTETVGRLGHEIYDKLMQAEPKMKLFVSHRDIMELMRYASDLAYLDADGERDTYIADISGIRNWLTFLRENNAVSISSIL